MCLECKPNFDLKETIADGNWKVDCVSTIPGPNCLGSALYDGTCDKCPFNYGKDQNGHCLLDCGAFPLKDIICETCSITSDPLNPVKCDVCPHGSYLNEEGKCHIDNC